MTPTKPLTHEQYLQRVHGFVVERAYLAGAISDDERSLLYSTKVVYGVGRPGVRGTCYYDTWTTPDGAKVPLVEVGSLSQENFVQLACTLVHELAHVLAGAKAGHSKDWKDVTKRLGFKRALKVGDRYQLSMLASDIRTYVYDLAKQVADGNPETWLALLGGSQRIVTPRPCSAGLGTKGGKSSGRGSGSRLRLYECACKSHDGRDGPWKVRVASDHFQATCDDCKFPFMKVEKS